MCQILASILVKRLGFTVLKFVLGFKAFSMDYTLNLHVFLQLIVFKQLTLQGIGLSSTRPSNGVQRTRASHEPYPPEENQCIPE